MTDAFKYFWWFSIFELVWPSPKSLNQRGYDRSHHFIVVFCPTNKEARYLVSIGWSQIRTQKQSHWNLKWSSSVSSFHLHPCLFWWKRSWKQEGWHKEDHRATPSPLLRHHHHCCQLLMIIDSMRTQHTVQGLDFLLLSLRPSPAIPLHPVMGAWKLSQVTRDRGEVGFISLAYVCQHVWSAWKRSWDKSQIKAGKTDLDKDSFPFP